MRPGLAPATSWVCPRPEAVPESGMQEHGEVQCPYCGQSMEVPIDTALERQRFTTDCEVCCRPFEVFAECESGELVSLETRT